MRLLLHLLLAGLVLVSSAGGARAAQPVLVADPAAWPDSRGEAYVITLWLRAQLERSDGPWADLGQHPDLATVETGKAKDQLVKLGAAGAIVLDTDAQGMTLTVRVRFVPLTPGVSAQAAVFAGSRKNLLGLCRSVGAWAAKLPGVASVPVEATVGDLSPFAEAAAALADKDGPRAQRALLTADPALTARMPVLMALARSVWSDGKRSMEERVALAARLAPPADALAMVEDARGKVPPDKLKLHKIRALIRLGRLADAELELARSKDDTGDGIWLMRAELAEAKSSGEDRDEALGHIADLAQPEVLAFVVTLKPGALPGQLEQRIVSDAARLGDNLPALTSAIGRRALAGGNTGPSALALIRVECLSEAQARDLADLLGKMPETSMGLRLRAELHARAEQTKLALADADKALAASPNDSQSLRLRGDLRVGSGQFKEGAADLEAAAAAGDKGAVSRRVHAMDLDGDCAGALALAESSGIMLPRIETLRLTACAAQIEGNLPQARKLLDEALAMDPDDPRVVARYADVLEAQKDPGAAQARAKAVRLAGQAVAAEKSDALAARLPTGGESADAAAQPVQPGDTGTAAEPSLPAPGAPVQAPPGERASLLASAAPAADQLASFLATFNELNTPGRRVVLIPLTGSHEGPWYPWQVHPSVLGKALELALAREPYKAVVMPTQGEPLTEPLAKDRMIMAAKQAGADTVMLYGLHAQGMGRAQVRLIMYRLDWADPHVYESGLKDSRGLVTVNRPFIAVLIALLVIGFLVGAYFFIRGWGSVTVRIKKDPAILDEAYCIRIHQEEEPPAIFEAASFAEQLRKGGVKADRRRANLVTASTTFSRIKPGRWFVHVWGTHKKGGDLRVLPRLTQEVRIARGKESEVEFDLVPHGAEFRVTIFDGESPVPSAKVWLDEASAHVAYTDAYGVAELEISKGRHTLHVMAGSMKLEKNLDVTTTKVINLTINLVRERAARDLKKGLAVATAEEVSGLSIETTSGETINVSGSAPRVEPPRKPAATAAARGMARGSEPAVNDDYRTPAAAGQAVNRYARVAELGRGAMGVVYRARDQVLERDVAMKVISDEVRAHPQVLQLFMQEARALAALNHPNIVAVYDQGYDEEGHAFMVMEWVEGETLEHLLERAGGRLPLRHTLAITKQILEGMAFAHGKRVIHRDMKPANVFVSADGRVKIGDFGLAKVMREIQIQRTEVRGTPLYMAPEQIFGSDIDHRADLYAIACTIFEMLAGQPPFVDGDVLYHHVHSPAPLLSSFNGEVPKELDAVLAKALAKKSHDRYGSAEELARAVIQAGMLGLK